MPIWSRVATRLLATIVHSRYQQHGKDPEVQFYPETQLVVCRELKTVDVLIPFFPPSPSHRFCVSDSCHSCPSNIALCCATGWNAESGPDTSTFVRIANQDSSFLCDSRRLGQTYILIYVTLLHNLGVSLDACKRHCPLVLANERRVLIVYS